MDFSLFDYFPLDPEGYYRHFLIGLLVVLGLKKQKPPYVLLILLVLGISKEAFDVYNHNRFTSLDVFFTVLPITLIKMDYKVIIALVIGLVMGLFIPKMYTPEPQIQSFMSKVTICTYAYNTLEVRTDTIKNPLGPSYVMKDYFNTPYKRKYTGKNPSQVNLMKVIPTFSNTQIVGAYNVVKEKCWTEELSPIQNDTI